MGIEVLFAAIVTLGAARMLDMEVNPWISSHIEKHISRNFDEHQVFLDISKNRSS